MLRAYKYTITFISWMVFVTWSSLFSFSDEELPIITIPHLDKLVHFTFYFVAVILMIFFFRERRNSTMKLKKALLASLFCMIFFGIIIEVFQYMLTVDRMGDIFDALANSIGALCGALVMKYIFYGKSGLNWK